MFVQNSQTSQEKPAKLKRILVPVSGNAADEDAINLACELGKKSKASIFVVYIIEVQRSLPLDAIVQSDLNNAEQILTRAENIASENDCEINTDLVQAREVGAAVVDEAVQKEADLILMGIEYKKRFGQFHLGDAIPYVLEEAPCSVLLLRRPIQGKVKK
ncbi:MAG TPA: universal stress protein [Dehalococcoidia bacterium]|nr:universal stress protein [Dehalococcoidia bacterium]